MRLLKPKQITCHVAAVRVYPDGREVCTDTPDGRSVYSMRRHLAWEMQDRRCAICQRTLRFVDAVTDHIQPRGMDAGRRDDRQENLQATCWGCNTEKSSKRGYK